MADTKTVLRRIDNEIKKLNDNSFQLLFFVPDAKNVASGYISYIYYLAYTLHEKGYNVKMIYQIENEYTKRDLADLDAKGKPYDEERMFIGVSGALGQKYADLPHENIMDQQLTVSPSDILFIPEVFSQIMNQTKKLACKRIVIHQNFDLLTDFIPITISWANFGITEAITQTKAQADLISESFPYVKTHVLPPYIPAMFKYSDDVDAPKKLIINLVTKTQKEANRIIKPFYWKNPLYKWVSFRDLRGYPKDVFAEYLKEGAITIWVDNETAFGYSPLEAMKAGNIVIGKIPESIPEWMTEEDKGRLRDNGIWFNDMNHVQEIIADVVRSWMLDEIPEELTNSMRETVETYTYTKYQEDSVKLIEEIKNERIREFEDVKTITKQNPVTEEKEEVLK